MNSNPEIFVDLLHIIAVRSKRTFRASEHNTTLQKFAVRKIFKEINNFIQQGHIELIKSDSKDIYMEDF